MLWHRLSSSIRLFIRWATIPGLPVRHGGDPKVLGKELGNDRLHHSGQGIDLFCQAKKRLRRDDGLPRTSLGGREPRVIEQTPAPTRDVKHPIPFVPDTFAGSVPKLFQLTSHELAS
ncbi:hypothetical protein BHE74_00010499 [Ensete ventricosum]|nr:hypothetical protein BHE74_00010499 [Ensete ventricosum]RZR80218.1 hypothetical protein BHM03_00006168 [Ensete ventricosum]